MENLKCNHRNCDALKSGESDEPAKPNNEGLITLLDGGNQVNYQDWMVGNCLDCITGIIEFEGYMEDTSPSDYMDAQQLNQGWNNND